MPDYQTELRRMTAAFEVADRVLETFIGADPNVRFKTGDDPLTDVDLALDVAIRDTIRPRPDEGWLSEETADDSTRLSQSKVWIVDPLDGTREFVAGIPEWCISIGFVVDGVPITGGVYAPSRGTTILGAVGHGVTVNGRRRSSSTKTDLNGASVLASRSELARGEWDCFRETPITITPMGSVALKAALVGAGESDATFSLTPKHEWDVAAASAIVLAGGGACSAPNGTALEFNRPNPLLTGFLASGSRLHPHIVSLIRTRSRT